MARHDVERRIRDLFGRVIADGETELLEELIHPDFVNHEADEERQHGPGGQAATADRLREAFGDIRFEFHQVPSTASSLPPT